MKTRLLVLALAALLLLSACSGDNVQEWKNLFNGTSTPAPGWLQEMLAEDAQAGVEATSIPSPTSTPAIPPGEVEWEVEVEETEEPEANGDIYMPLITNSEEGTP